MKMTVIYLLLLVVSSAGSISLDIRYPQFFHQSSVDCTIEITEGKTIGTFIAFINLINGTNLAANQWMLNTTNKDFQIQSNDISYSLVTTQVLDRERQNFYNFSIDAQQLVPPYTKLSKNIAIRILDVNDCVPTFNQTFYQTTLIPTVSTFTVTANDGDEPNMDNSRISYALANYQDLFRINESTGCIECLRNLHTYERYEIIVIARDYGKPSLSSSTLVQIQLISSKMSRKKSSSIWFHVEQSPENILIVGGILAACFVFLSLFICLICCLKYKIKQRRARENFHDKQFPSTSSINSSTNDHHHQQTSVYDAIHIFPNTYYLPAQQQDSEHLHPDASLPSTTSSPISATGVTNKVGSDDGCYCSSDMSSEQSNNTLLLNPSSLPYHGKFSSKHVRFHEHEHIDGVLKRFENLYDSQAVPDHCASYV